MRRCDKSGHHLSDRGQTKGPSWAAGARTCALAPHSHCRPGRLISLGMGCRSPFSRRRGSCRVTDLRRWDVPREAAQQATVEDTAPQEQVSRVVPDAVFSVAASPELFQM